MKWKIANLQKYFLKYYNHICIKYFIKKKNTEKTYRKTKYSYVPLNNYNSLTLIYTTLTARIYKQPLQRLQLPLLLLKPPP